MRTRNLLRTAAWALSASVLAMGSAAVNRAHAQGVAATVPASVDATTSGVVDAAKSVKPGKSERIFIRGWEITGAKAVKRGKVVEVFPAFANKKRAGLGQRDVLPKRGQFLVVQLDVQWATGQPPNEPLWVGKPDLTLVDDVGLEYAASDAVSKVGPDFVPTSIGALPAREKRGKEQSNHQKIYVYFDLPTTAQNYWLKFSPSLPILPIISVTDLP